MSESEDLKLQDALEKFEQIMEYRSAMHLRLVRRVRSVVRGGMAIMAMVGIALFLLLLTLVIQADRALESTRTLDHYVADMEQDMAQVHDLIASMNRRMEVIQTIGQSITSMQGDTGSMAGDLQQLSDSVGSMEQRMQLVDRRLEHVAHNMGGIGQMVNGMGHDVYQMSKPAQSFNILPLP